MELSFGMAVVGTDDAEAGILDRVLVDPRTREVTHVVVRSPRVSEDVLLPLSLVQGDVEGRLLLHVASWELENLPRYYEGRISTPPAGRIDTSVVREAPEQRQILDRALAVPADVREYGPDTKVITIDEVEGRLLALTTDQYVNQLTEIRVGGLHDHDVVVPERWIAETRPDSLTVAATAEETSQLIGPQEAPYISVQSGEPRKVIERRSRPGSPSDHQ